MNVTKSSLAATSQIAAFLIAQHGWTISVAGAAADLRTDKGVFSLGHDGTVVQFYRRDETGCPLVDLDLGAVDLAAGPAVAAAQVVALLA
jgi:hypothetical protein